MKFQCNGCDGIYNSYDVHFTSACDNNCAHCIDRCYGGLKINKPNVDKIVDTIILNQEGLDDVLFLGGEPCLYLEELIDCVEKLKKRTQLKLYVTTSVPKICYDKRERFKDLISIVDGLNISVQHYREDIADTIRRTKSQYDRQTFYQSLPFKEKIRVNLNIVKPYLCTKEEITACLKHYDEMGFNAIKLIEVQHATQYYVSFEKIFGMHLGSPYSNGCQTYLDMEEIIPGFKTPVILRRACFICEETVKASIGDGIKVLCKLLRKAPENKFGIIYEDGSLKKGWV